MDFNVRKQAFVALGARLKYWLQKHSEDQAEPSYFSSKLELAANKNPWFIPGHIVFALHSIANNLTLEQLNKWLEPYESDLKKERRSRKIAVIMAGNIPLVGFHDFLCTLMAGHRFLGKLSSQDEVLLPLLASLLMEVEPEFSEYIEFSTETIKDFHAVIATGSNNTARYFEYYFGKYPHIIRKNRTAIAIINGDESVEQLRQLGRDVFLYFGLGCRNVSKIYVPENYNVQQLLEHFDDWDYVARHHKYMNNYDYFKSIYLINREEFHDNGFLLIKQENKTASPVSVLFYERWTDTTQLFKRLNREALQIQCVVAGEIDNKDFPAVQTTSFGKAQQPALWNYADNIDTMDFLLSL